MSMHNYLTNTELLYKLVAGYNQAKIEYIFARKSCRGYLDSVCGNTWSLDYWINDLFNPFIEKRKGALMLAKDHLFWGFREIRK